jgi:hypothetical protein
LGVLYEGVCHAGTEPFRPGAEALTDNCNMGYASGRCPHFRPGSGDAVRFAVAQRPGQVDVVRWLVESDSLPVRSGETPCSVLDGGVPAGDIPANVVAQLRAYFASYRAACEPGRDDGSV